METPVIDFLEKYADSGTMRCHMPGHKGYGSVIPETLARLDITEISGADSLFDAEGIIAQAEKNTSSLYHTAGTVWSAGGSTLCIQAMLAIMKRENRRIYAVRNVHRAFLNAAALLDLDVEWLMPDYSGGILSGEFSTDAAEKVLKKSDVPACIYITSPDYTGKIADIRGLSAVCRKYGARLLVDNAHGAHLAFLPENIHPIALGADMCCDSAHKMLPALTGAAFLHTSVPEYVPLLKAAMGLFGSTSPSYLIMASLDLCNKYISEQINADILALLPCIYELRRELSDRLIFADGDPFHITVKAADSGFDGNELAGILRKNGCECEYSDSELLILLLSPVSKCEDVERLKNMLKTALSKAKPRKIAAKRFEFALPERVMSIREAVFSTSEDVDVENSEGRICAAVKVPCPPAIPIAASGERIDRQCIEIFKHYGIKNVNVTLCQYV